MSAEATDTSRLTASPAKARLWAQRTRGVAAKDQGGRSPRRRGSVLFLDADGSLFPSEEIAFGTSSKITDELLSSLNLERRYSAEELRRATLGHAFASPPSGSCPRPAQRCQPPSSTSGWPVSRDR